MAEGTAVEGGPAALDRARRFLLHELIEERQAEIAAIIAKVKSRPSRPSGLYDWKRSEARDYRLTCYSLQSLRSRLAFEVSVYREVHRMFFGEYYAPGGGPNCGYRGEEQPNVNLKGIEVLIPPQVSER